jgi:hypothetical protein
VSHTWPDLIRVLLYPILESLPLPPLPPDREVYLLVVQAALLPGRTGREVHLLRLFERMRHITEALNNAATVLSLDEQQRFGGV